jgi:hypothetical protein
MNPVFITVRVFDAIDRKIVNKREIAVNSIVSMETLETSKTKWNEETEEWLIVPPVPYTQLVTGDRYNHTIAETPEDIKKMIFTAKVNENIALDKARREYVRENFWRKR